MKTNQKPLSIYIHIPFCVRKCLYCDFLSAPADTMAQEKYLHALIREIEREAGQYADYEVQTVFIGGGTPSVIPATWMEKILQTVYSRFQLAKDAEITIEVNPGTVDMEKLTAYHEMGINRLSIGLQSADNEELKQLGRIHSFEDFLQTYEYVIKSGFNNVNVDLMSAIPLQTVESYQNTLKKVLSLEPAPTHISAYSLIIEEGTFFYENTPVLPDEDTDRELYKITNDILRKNGYHRYEISNYAKEGYECRHNKVYWKRGDYVGFGIGAASLVENRRFSNIRDREQYAECMEGAGNAIKEQEEILSADEQMEEYMFLGLRLTQGVSKEAFQRTFGRELDEAYPGLVKRLEEQGLMTCKKSAGNQETYLALTEYGLDVSNVVMAEFLLKSES